MASPSPKDRDSRFLTVQPGPDGLLHVSGGDAGRAILAFIPMRPGVVVTAETDGEGAVLSLQAPGEAARTLLRLPGLDAAGVMAALQAALPGPTPMALHRLGGSMGGADLPAGPRPRSSASALAFGVIGFLMALTAAGAGLAAGLLSRPTMTAASLPAAAAAPAPLAGPQAGQAPPMSTMAQLGQFLVDRRRAQNGAATAEAPAAAPPTEAELDAFLRAQAARGETLPPEIVRDLQDAASAASPAPEPTATATPAPVAEVSPASEADVYARLPSFAQMQEAAPPPLAGLPSPTPRPTPTPSPVSGLDSFGLGGGGSAPVSPSGPIAAPAVAVPPSTPDETPRATPAAAASPAP